MIFLLEVDYYNYRSGMIETLFLTTSKSYSLDGKVYLPVLDVGLDFEESLFSRGTTGGDSSSSIGVIVIPNSNGQFDYLSDAGFDGREFRSYWVENENSKELNPYVTGTVSYPEASVDDITLHISDVLERYNYKMLRSTFAGTNLGMGAAGGLEGGEDDIKGQNKPALYGRCRNIQPFLVNAFHLIYAMNYDKNGNRKAVHSIWNVYGKGAEYLYEGDEADGDALLLASVSPGYYKTCLAEGLIRLGTVPNGEVTCDAMESFGEQSSAGNVIHRILEEYPDVSYDLSSLEALKQDFKCPVGIFLTGEQTVLEVIRSILSSVDAWIVPDYYSSLTFGRVPPVLNKPKYRIKKEFVRKSSFEKVPTSDNARNIPARSVAIKHTRNWKVIDAGSLIDAVPLERAEFFSTEFRTAVVSDNSVSVAHPSAVDLEYETLLQAPMPAKLRNGNFSQPLSESPPQDWGFSSESEGDTYVISNGVCEIVKDVGAKLSQTLESPDEIFDGEYTLTLSASGPVLITVDDSLGSVYNGTIAPEDQRISLTFSVVGTTSIGLEPPSVGSVQISNVRLTESNKWGTPEDEATRRHSLQSVKGERYTFKTDYRHALNFKVGDEIEFSYDRFSLEEGKSFIVIGRSLSLPSLDVELDIWRPMYAS